MKKLRLSIILENLFVLAFLVLAVVFFAITINDYNQYKSGFKNTENIDEHIANVSAWDSILFGGFVVFGVSCILSFVIQSFMKKNVEKETDSISVERNLRLALICKVSGFFSFFGAMLASVLSIAYPMIIGWWGYLIAGALGLWWLFLMHRLCKRLKKVKAGEYIIRKDAVKEKIKREYLFTKPKIHYSIEYSGQYGRWDKRVDKRTYNETEFGFKVYSVYLKDIKVPIYHYDDTFDYIKVN